MKSSLNPGAVTCSLGQKRGRKHSPEPTMQESGSFSYLMRHRQYMIESGKWLKEPLPTRQLRSSGSVSETQPKTQADSANVGADSKPTGSDTRLTPEQSKERTSGR